MGEIGSLKNRWKQWWKNRKRQKKLEEQEVEDKKKKKQYNRFQVATRTIFGLFLGLLETTIFSSKKKEQTIRPKEMKIKLEGIEKNIVIVKQQQKQIIERIPNTKTHEELASIVVEHHEVKKSVASLTEQHQQMKKQVKLMDNKKRMQRDENINQTQKKTYSMIPIIKAQEKAVEELIENEKLIEQKIENQGKVIEQTTVISEEELQKDGVKQISTQKKKMVGVDSDREELQHYLKENNQLVKEMDSFMKRLSEPIGDDEIELTLFAISNFYDKLFPHYLTETSIRHRIRFSKYNNDRELKKIDKAGFLLSDGVYKERLDKCEEKKRELQNRQSDKVRKLEKEKQEEKKLAQKRKKINQLELEKQQLKNTLLEQRIMISSLERGLDKLSGSKKKKGILSRMGALVKNTLFAGLGITTILKSKRSMLGILTGVLLTNHGIRGMRNMNRSNDDKIHYFDVEKILEQIKSEKDALAMSLDFCGDSLDQLQDLKMEIMATYPYTDDIEVTSLKEQLFELEEQLVSQQQKLLEHQQQMEIAYEKGVQKIKKLEEKS